MYYNSDNFFIRTQEENQSNNSQRNNFNINFNNKKQTSNDELVNELENFSMKSFSNINEDPNFRSSTSNFVRKEERSRTDGIQTKKSSEDIKQSLNLNVMPYERVNTKSKTINQLKSYFSQFDQQNAYCNKYQGNYGQPSSNNSMSTNETGNFGNYSNNSNNLYPMHNYLLGNVSPKFSPKMFPNRMNAMNTIKECNELYFNPEDVISNSMSQLNLNSSHSYENTNPFMSKQM